MTMTVFPSDLFEGDALASDPSIYVESIYVDHEGTWVEWSDGDQGYQVRPVKIIREEM